MDPTEEFLARERELLGDDALLFGNPLGATTDAVNTVDDFGGFSHAPAASQPEPTDLFGQSEVDTHFDTGFSNQDFTSQHAGLFGALPMENNNHVPDESHVETEADAVRAWRENFEMAIADRDARSTVKNEETLRSAKESLDRFYAEYNDKKNKTVARNKESEKAALALQESSTGNVWERVVKQIDTSVSSSANAAKLKEKIKADGSKDDRKRASAAAAPKAKDTSRMKSLLISLKADKSAPGADV
ncbi:hypothetical protein HDU78_003637 [Chytriomyces hyalinus]|nr:hypothetical protein HDU78_003637 [Chytriomyces hyalinus]